MITFFMCREFYKSGEFDKNKNEYAGLDVLFRIPFFIVFDIALIVKIFEIINS